MSFIGTKQQSISDRSKQGATSASTSFTNSPSSTCISTEDSPSRAVWGFRILFVIFLVGMAVALAFLGFSVVQRAEHALAEQQYEAIADRALTKGQELAMRRRMVVQSMAQIAASAFPLQQDWPNVAIPAFETYAQDLIRTSDSLEVGFYPKVQPEGVFPGEQTAFEEFAYDYFYKKRSPPFPNTTAVKTFGRGVWADHKNHDQEGYTLEWKSPHKVLFPELQKQNGLEEVDDENGSLFLMSNIHSDLTSGRPLDEVLDCTIWRKATGNVQKDCAVVTKILPWDRVSHIIQPIYPANDPLEFTGVIMSKVSWDVILQNMFEGTVASGLTAVMQSEGKSYTYQVQDGSAVYDGEGGTEISTYKSYARTITLEGTHISGVSSRAYTLILYPTEEFFDIYSTNSPFFAMVGAVIIVLVTSIVFFLYDSVVRREFSAKQQLLQAKRAFMRFVSHEVRTPLNAVCLGLKLLQDEMQVAATAKEPFALTTQLLNFTTARRSCASGGSSNSCCTSKKKDMEAWLTLIQEIRSSATSSVDVLNDLLNYDKIETKTLSLELSIFSIQTLLKEISSEFRLSAETEKIHFELADDMELEEATQPQGNVVGDSMRIAQVLRNLCSNAIKFTPENGKVSIRMTFEDIKPTTPVSHKFTLVSGEEITCEKTGAVHISVIDTGAGMTKEELTKLGREGIQFNVNELQAGCGSGLGMFITKGIVQQHGGELAVSSDGLELGTTFTCVLPLYNAPTVDAHADWTMEVTSDDPSLGGEEQEQQPHKEEHDKESGKEEFRPLRILVVDDVATNRKLLSRIVKNRGHIVEDACDGRVAVNKVKELLKDNARYDTILMDYEMPVLRGPEAAKEIRELGCDSFIVGITGNLLAEDVTYFTACGANHVLPKPVNLGKLNDLWVEHGVLSPLEEKTVGFDVCGSESSKGS